MFQKWQALCCDVKLLKGKHRAKHVKKLRAMRDTVAETGEHGDLLERMEMALRIF